MLTGDRVFVAGHRGLVGSAIVGKLREKGYENLLLRTRSELDLTDQAAVRAYFQSERPDHVVLAAAKVGGILANSTYPADFIYQNLAIEVNIIHEAWRAGVKKLLFLGSSCIYPKLASQPLKEEYLLTSSLEPTNEAYAIAKIAGLKMCEFYNRQYGARFISVMPTNLYGPGDNFDLETSHVLPAMVRKFHEAKERGDRSVTLWGTGRPRREFLYVEDLADACIFLMENYESPEFVNVGTGTDITIAGLAELVRHTVGFEGDVLWDDTKPDGTPRKLLDVSRMKELGWSAAIALEEGLRRTYDWYRKLGDGMVK